MQRAGNLALYSFLETIFVMKTRPMHVSYYYSITSLYICGVTMCFVSMVLRLEFMGLLGVIEF